LTFATTYALPDGVPFERELIGSESPWPLVRYSAG
jgi:hypothetical protein